MFYNGMDEWYWDRPDIRRTVFIDDYVYAISQHGVTVHQLDTMELSASADLPFNTPSDMNIFEGEPREENEEDPDQNRSFPDPSGSVENGHEP